MHDARMLFQNKNQFMVFDCFLSTNYFDNLSFQGFFFILKYFRFSVRISNLETLIMQIFIVKSQYSKSFEQFAIFSETSSTIIVAKNCDFGHTTYDWIFDMIVLARIRICMNGDVLNENFK